MDSKDEEAINHLKNFLSSENTELPINLVNKAFFKTIITKFLHININHLTSTQRTKLYNELNFKLKHIKTLPEMKDGNNKVLQDLKILKAYLSKWMENIINVMLSPHILIPIKEETTTNEETIETEVTNPESSNSGSSKTVSNVDQNEKEPSTSEEIETTKTIVDERKEKETESAILPKPGKASGSEIRIELCNETQESTKKKRTEKILEKVRVKNKQEQPKKRKGSLSKSPRKKNDSFEMSSSSISLSEIESSDNFTSDMEFSAIESPDIFDTSTPERDLVPVTEPTVIEFVEVPNDPKLEVRSQDSQDLQESQNSQETQDSQEKLTSLDISRLIAGSVKFKKENALCFEGSYAKLYECLFEHNPESNILSIEKGSPVPTESRELFELKDLLFWPGVGVKIDLPAITIQRFCDAGFQHELIEQNVNDQIPNEHLTPNKDTVFYYHASKSEKRIASLNKETELSHEFIQSYLEAIIKCLEITNLAKKNEIKLILQTMLDDLNKIARSFEKVSYSYFLNDHKYYRTFGHQSNSLPESNPKNSLLREFYNPEVVFTITKCQLQELSKIDLGRIQSYFTKILFEKDPDAIEEFNEKLREGYILFCVACQKNNEKEAGQFNCAKRVALLSQHIGKYCLSEFNCVKCGYHANINELVKEEWHHFCEDHEKEKILKSILNSSKKP